MDDPTLIELPPTASRAARSWELLHRTPHRRVVVGAVLAIVLIGILSSAAPLGLNLDMLVVVPVALAAAIAGLATGVSLAAFAALTLAVLEFVLADVSIGVGLGNLGLRLLGLLTVALVVHTMLELLRYAAVLSWTDELTGLPNRRAWCNRAELELARARRNPSPITVAYLDVDGFKGINDRFGHDLGDQVLRELAILLRDRLRETDMAARLGGDEFVLLLPDTGRADAIAFLRSLKAAFHARVNGAQVPFTVSIGAATFRQPPSSVSALLTLSDELMYRAKQRGQGAFEHGLDRPVVARVDVAAAAARGHDSSSGHRELYAARISLRPPPRERCTEAHIERGGLDVGEQREQS